MPLLIHYPNSPIADAHPTNSDELRQLVAVARINGIPFRLVYPTSSGDAYRYGCDGARFSR
jgi:hypothetical protein